MAALLGATAGGAHAELKALIDEQTVCWRESLAKAGVKAQEAQ